MKHRLIIPDESGHRELAWTDLNEEELREAERAFNDAVTRGFVPHVPGTNGEPGTVIHRFEPNAEEIVLLRPLVGG